MALTAGALVKQHHFLKMIPSFQIPTSVSIPDALPIPNIPYKLPSYSMPRWTPIVPPLPELQMLPVPRTAPIEEKVEEDKPEKKPAQSPVNPPASPPLNLKVPILEPEVIAPAPIPVEAKTPLIIEIPFVGEMPVPSKELLVTSGATAAIAASVSVVAALSAKSLVNHLLKVFKPIIKFIMKKILKRNNKYTISWARQRRLKVPNRHK